MEQSEIFINLPNETNLLMDALWAEVKMGGPGDSLVLVAIILVFLAAYIAIIVWKRLKRRREMG